MENDTIKQYVSNINGYYIKDEEARESIEGKADAGTTLSDYGITDAYTKSEVNESLSTKADSSTTYTKTEVDSAINNQAQTFNFTHFDTFDKDHITINNTDLSGFNDETSITVASNDDGTLCKIYGAMYPEDNATIVNTFNVSIQTRLRPTSDFTIYPLGILRRNQTNYEVTRSVWGRLKTTGELVITCTLNHTDDFGIYLWPCLYFVKDFGDTGGEDD